MCSHKCHSTGVEVRGQLLIICPSPPLTRSYLCDKCLCLLSHLTDSQCIFKTLFQLFIYVWLYEHMLASALEASDHPWNWSLHKFVSQPKWVLGAEFSSSARTNPLNLQATFPPSIHTVHFYWCF